MGGASSPANTGPTWLQLIPCIGHRLRPARAGFPISFPPGRVARDLIRAHRPERPLGRNGLGRPAAAATRRPRVTVQMYLQFSAARPRGSSSRSSALLSSQRQAGPGQVITRDRATARPGGAGERPQLAPYRRRSRPQGQRVLPGVLGGRPTRFVRASLLKEGGRRIGTADVGNARKSQRCS